MSHIDTTDPSQFGFPKGSVIYDCDPRTRRAIIDARSRLRGAECFQMFWDRVLTSQERERLGGDVEICFDRDRISANHLVLLRGWSAEHAIVEIAFLTGFLAPAEYEWLLREIGIENSEPQPGKQLRSPEIPMWDRGTGRLEFRGELCRKINVRAALAIVPILENFQSQKWPASIESPVDISVNRQRIHDAVSNLNCSLLGIRFRVQGDSICWSETEHQ